MDDQHPAGYDGDRDDAGHLAGRHRYGDQRGVGGSAAVRQPRATEAAPHRAPALNFNPLEAVLLDADEAREIGLALAVELYAGTTFDFGGPGVPVPGVLETAGVFADFLTARPHRLRLTAAPYTFPLGLSGPGTPTEFTGGENSMAVTMTDTEQVTYSCAPEDSRGFPVADTLTWSESSGGAVVTATPSEDGTSCVFAAVAPGTSTISVTDGSLSAEDTITVDPGAVAQLVLTPGTPEAIPAA